MPFDPCREWLGIDAVDLGDPHRVLGIPFSETNADAIIHAAEARLAELREISPGPFARAHEALQARVHEARDALLTTAVRMPPAEPVDVAAAPDLPLPSPFVSVRRPVARRSKRPNGSAGILITVGSLLAASVAVVAFFMISDNGVLKQVAVVTPTPKPTPTAKPTPPPPAKVEPAPTPEPRRPAVPEPEPAPEPALEPAPAPELIAEEVRQNAAARARMIESLETSLRDAHRALQREEFDTADRTIKAASREVGDDVEANSRLERWRLFATYARGFIGYQERAFEAATAGREYEAEGRIFSVIEITPTIFIYKLAGKIERVPRDRVDPRIAMAIVESWFAADGRAANHLFLGAHWLCLDPPDTRRARGEWQIAGVGGEQVGPLLMLLDDPVIRRAARR